MNSGYVFDIDRFKRIKIVKDPEFMDPYLENPSGRLKTVYMLNESQGFFRACNGQRIYLIVGKKVLLLREITVKDGKYRGKAYTCPQLLNYAPFKFQIFTPDITPPLPIIPDTLPVYPADICKFNFSAENISDAESLEREQRRWPTISDTRQW